MFFRIIPFFRQLGGLAALFAICIPAHAGLSYSLNTDTARPGEHVSLHAVVFNDTPSTLNWAPPASLTVRWYNSAGQYSTSTATLAGTPQNISLPVNTFAKLEWLVKVPGQARGLQAVQIEGQTGQLALRVPDDATAFGGDTPVDDATRPAGNAQTAHTSSHLAPTAMGAPALSGMSPSGSSDLFQRFSNAISPHEPIYFDLGNKGGRNARFQISLKYRLFTPDDPANPEFIDSLYLGYTQTSLWDLASDSLPFVDTSFKPSLFWRRDALWQAQDRQLFLGLAGGVEHESNGKGGDESRSLNFAYIQPEFNYRLSHGSTLSFTPRIKSYFGTSNNPDYADYAGYVDWKLRWAQDNGLILTGLYRHGRSGNHSTQLEAAWPLKRTFLNMNGYLHVQYFQGYGQTLLGYNQKSDPQVRIGLSLIP